jgi:single-strand DNA-binding protein|tara:strand:+ start:444 stop:839 length:396 start_codon:yes stop_codon:yes gene_type:complete
MYSKAILIGRLGRDPEFKTTTNNKAVCNFSLACDNGYGEHKKTSWFDIVSFQESLNDKLIRPYVKKGSTVYIEGELRIRTWEKDGKKGKSTEVFLGGGSIIKLLSSSNSNQSSSQDDNKTPSINQGPPSLD